MTEYIEREALIESVKSKHIVITSITSAAEAVQTQGRLFREAVDNAPAVDAVKVVRCKDCKHRNSAIDLCKWFDCCTDDDDFCSHGKKKGENK